MDEKSIRLDDLLEYFNKISGRIAEHTLSVLPEIVEALKKGEYEVLKKKFDLTELNDPEIMVPLLRAVKNDNKTYVVYKHSGERVQTDTKLAIEVIEEEPSLIEGTTLSNNREFIKERAKVNPNIVLYMGSQLKGDKTFIHECIIAGQEPVLEKLREAVDPRLLKDSLNEHTAILKIMNASEVAKNNYRFIEEQCNNNPEIITYIAEHTAEFGTQGLLAAKDTLSTKSTESAIDGFRNEAQAIRDSKDENKTKEELVEIDRKADQMERHAKFFEKMKEDIASGKQDPAKLARKLNTLCKNMDPSFRKQMEQIIGLDLAIHEREQNKENPDNENQLATQINPERLQQKSAPDGMDR